MNTLIGKRWKHWARQLKADDRVKLRIDGKLYEQRMQRLMAHARLADLMAIYQEKYGAGLRGWINWTRRWPRVLSSCMKWLNDRFSKLFARFDTLLPHPCQ